MEEVAQLGLAKAIGVSNFSGGLLVDLFRYAVIKPAAIQVGCSLTAWLAELTLGCLQVELHPYFDQRQLVELATTFGVAVTACEFRAVALPAMSDAARNPTDSSLGPASWIEINHELALKTPSLLDHDTITTIAKRHGKSSAQILLRWATQRGIAVIPKSNNA